MHHYLPLPYSVPIIHYPSCHYATTVGDENQNPIALNPQDSAVFLGCNLSNLIRPNPSAPAMPPPPAHQPPPPAPGTY